MKKLLIIICTLAVVAGYSQGTNATQQGFLKKSGGTMTGTLNFTNLTGTSNSSTITIGEQVISRRDAYGIQFSHGVYFGNGSTWQVTSAGSAYFNGLYVTSRTYLKENIGFLNKSEGGYLPFATRNTSGSEAKYDLSNTGDVSQGVANYHYFGDATTDGSWRSYVNAGVYTVEYRTGGVWVSKMTLTP